jgi:hypothetical protein
MLKQTLKLKVKLLLRLIKHNAMKRCMQEWRYSSTTLDLGIRLEVNNQLHDLAAFLPGIESQCPLDR